MLTLRIPMRLTLGIGTSIKVLPSTVKNVRSGRVRFENNYSCTKFPLLAISFHNSVRRYWRKESIIPFRNTALGNQRALPHCNTARCHPVNQSPSPNQQRGRRRKMRNERKRRGRLCTTKRLGECITESPRTEAHWLHHKRSKVHCVWRFQMKSRVSKAYQ